MADVVILSGNFFIKEATRNKKEPFSPSKSSQCRALGAYQIAHHLRKHGITCQVIDYVQLMNELELISFIRKFLPSDRSLPSILGISRTFFPFKNKKFPPKILHIIKTIKGEYPNLKVVVGGASAMYVNQKLNFIDYSISGYAEDVALELFSGILKKTPLKLEYKLSTKIERDNTDFNICESDHRFIREDCIRHGETLPLEISRGCIFKCAFCRYRYTGKKKNDYIRDIEEVKNEILYNYKNFGTTNYYILDDTFNETPHKVQEFYDMTQSLPFKINYFAYIRADLLHRFPETAVQLMESGLTAAIFGIETLGEQSSKLVGKAWSGKHAREFLKELKQNIWKDRVSINTNFIVGLPPDTLPDLLEMQSYITSIGIEKLTWHVFSFSSTGDKLSEIEKHPEKYGFTLFPENKWHNGLYSRDEANVYYDILTNHPIRPDKISAYSMMECMAFYDKDTMMKTPFCEFRDDLYKKREIYYSQYLKLLNSL